MYRVLLILFFILAFLGITFAQFEITIDAEKDAWYGTLMGPDEGYIHIPYYAKAGGDAIPDSAVDEYDLSAWCWLAWDDFYLYFYTEVWDDVVLVNNSTTYQNDAVEFKMDPDPFTESTGDPPNCRLSSLGEDVADEPLGVDFPGKDAGLGEQWDATADGDYARMETDLGYNLEFRLPWDMIHYSSTGEETLVQEGSIFGLAINIMDNDETQRTTIIQWSSGMHDFVWSDVTLHGTVTFLADNKLKMEPFNSAGGADPLSDPSWYIPEIDVVGPENGAVVPSEFKLAQNYPNPFNPSTTISYSVPKTSKVILTVYDVMGREIAVLENSVKAAGTYSVSFNATDLSSGIYFYRMMADNKVFTKKFTVLK